jgi:3-hydroxyacyl-CoA dehydrogenase/enoyl-CoA hydratase/3-hydroxybutyryl-CoA epimerase/enoyl-CoA isomerase
MIYSGSALNVTLLSSGIANLTFDLRDSSVNKFNELTLRELREAIDVLMEADISGLIFSSAKPAFIVGADITEFTGMFDEAEGEITKWLVEGNQIFNDIEDLPCPTVSAISGVALGGGFEMALSTDFRVVTEGTKVGFPEVKLGILPGFGGTVRLPRLIGADNANQWISAGSHIKARQALNEGAIDAIVSCENLLPACENLIAQCLENKLSTQRIRQQKKSPLTLSEIELNVAFETALGLIAPRAGPNYPAPVVAVKVMQSAANLDREGALQAEHKGFVELAKTEVAKNLVQMFLNDQYLSSAAKKHSHNASEVKKAGVLGAGIMGGGIAYQSALKGVPILMKDIAQEGLDLGVSEAGKLLNKQRARGRIDIDKVVSVLGDITPVLDYQGFDKVDVIIEAIVENVDVKKGVLAELEALIPASATIASNTSTISIDELSLCLKRPENFCGMHFFNPVPVMPLVEIIRGSKTSEDTIAKTVAYAKKMGKTPIVVNNCPGFLVNRILFPYFGAFSRLIHDGADFNQIDKAMEEFGWPMGPAYLLDVIGVDTAVHCQDVMADGFPRMKLDFESAIDKLYQGKNFGQKTGKGFYSYEMDKRGKPKKLANDEIKGIIQSVQETTRDFSNDEIIERMMIPMCIETALCLEDGIVGSPIEADMGLVLGLGFPPFRGGALRHTDSLGLSTFCDRADVYSELGELYKPSSSMREMGRANEIYYQ